MKQHWLRTLALLMALTLLVVTLALAEETAPGDADDSILLLDQGDAPADAEPAVGEVGDILLDDPGDEAEAQPTAAEEVPEESDWTGVQTWWFIVGEETVAAQEAAEGDEIQQPEDPAAPEGQVFDGWYLEDGTRLFADDEPVVAHPDLLTPDVIVLAKFVDAEEPADEQPADEQPADEQPADEQPADEQPADEQPADEQPADGEQPIGDPEEEVADPEAPAAEEMGDGEAQDAPALPIANELTYTGEPQALVSGEGWLFSLDGESYGAEIPTAVNAGEYIVYFIPADDAEAEPQALTVIVAKADVTFTPPEAATGEE